MAPAPGKRVGQQGERSRPPLEDDSTCHAVTGPITPAGPNRPVTASVAATTAATKSCHGDPESLRHHQVDPGQPGHQREVHPHRLQTGAHPPQPAADRRRRHAEQQPDPPMTTTGRPCQQPGPDHPGGVGPPQQHRDRQQHMRDQAARAPCSPRPQRPDPTDPTRSGPTPRSEHPVATRAIELPTRQTGLDPNLICLYRDQRVPPCI